MRGGCGAIRVRVSGACARAELIPAVADLFVADHHWTHFAGLSMGQPAAGNRVFGDIFCSGSSVAKVRARDAAISDRTVAAALAALSPDVLLRLREAAERGPDVAQSNCAELSL